MLRGRLFFGDPKPKPVAGECVNGACALIDIEMMAGVLTFLNDLDSCDVQANQADVPQSANASTGDEYNSADEEQHSNVQENEAAVSKSADAATWDEYNSADDEDYTQLDDEEESLSSEGSAADEDIDPTEIQDLEAGNAESTTLCKPKISTKGSSKANAKPSKGRSNANTKPSKSASKANTKPPKDRSKAPSWRNSDAKKIIAKEMCDSSSEIHNMSPMQIHAKYASKYPFENFKTNYANLLKKLIKEGGVDSKLYASKTTTKTRDVKWQNSTGRLLLFKLFMDVDVFKAIQEMTARQLWESDSLFQEYSFYQFANYYDSMMGITDERKKHVKVC